MCSYSSHTLNKMILSQTGFLVALCCLSAMQFIQPVLSDKLIEYRIPFPTTVERVGQRYTVDKTLRLTEVPIEVILDEIRSGEINLPESINVLYTRRLLRLEETVPSYIRLLAIGGYVEVFENSWNAYPITLTKYSNTYMKDSFHVIINSLYKNGACTENNAFNLNDAELSKRKIDKIDLTNVLPPYFYNKSKDPTVIRSSKLGLGHLTSDWQKEAKDLMCVYKLVNIKFKWFHLQTKVENDMEKAIRMELLRYFKRAFAYADQWYDMTMDQISDLEKETNVILEKRSVEWYEARH